MGAHTHYTGVHVQKSANKPWDQQMRDMQIRPLDYLMQTNGVLLANQIYMSRGRVEGGRGTEGNVLDGRAELNRRSEDRRGASALSVCHPHHTRPDAFRETKLQEA